MRPGSVRVLCAIIFLISCAKAKAQIYKQLSIGDFKGRPHSDGLTVAATACFIDLKYDVHARNGIYKLTFYVNLLVNNEQSWIDRARINTPGLLAEILKHEQGHYTINYFEQQELQHELDARHFTENYKEEVTAVFDRMHAKYDQLNKDYDDDTDNSRNKIQQASWDKYFQRRLGYVTASR
jgi:hypothetical protein